MKREMMMKLVFTSWLVLILSVGSQTSFGADDDHESTSGASGTRRAVEEVPLPQEYDMLLEALGKIDSRGLDIKSAVTVEDETKDLDGSVADKAKLIKWIETVKAYRQATATCTINGDKSADALGSFIDEMILDLQAAISLEPRDAEGLEEKHLITFVSQIERYMAEKKKLFPGQVEDFEESDKALVEQLKKTLATVFGAVNFDKFTLEQQKTDTFAKPLSEKMDKAIEALTLHKENDRKACVAKKDAEDDDKKEDDKKDDDKKDDDKKDGDKKDDDKKDDDKEKLTDKPTPILGNGKEPGEEDPGAGTEDPADPGAGDPGAGDPGAGDPGVGAGVEEPFDPFGQGIVDPGDQVVEDLDDAFLRDILDRLADQEKDQEDNFEKLLDDAQDRLNDGLRAAQDAAAQIARDQANALDAQENKDAANLADIAKGLNGKNGQTPPPPPAPIPPISPPPISAGGGSDSGLPFLPPQEEQPFPPEPQQPPPFFMPPPQPSSSGYPLAVQEESRFEDDFIPYRPRPVPQPQNPQGGGLLEIVRLQQQLMFAQQQAQQNPANVRLNVNTIGARLGGAGPTTGTRVIPNGSSSIQNRLGTTSRTTQGGTTSVNPGARSSTVPASLQRGKL